MGICCSVIPKETMRAARIIAKLSGFNKDIITRYYLNHSCEVVYSMFIPLYISVFDRGATTKSPEIIHIHVVTETNDLIVETLHSVYIISSNLGIPAKRTYTLQNIDDGCDDDINAPLI
jgi:hypothetical protein